MYRRECLNEMTNKLGYNKAAARAARAERTEHAAVGVAPQRPLDVIGRAFLTAHQW